MKKIQPVDFDKFQYKKDLSTVTIEANLRHTVIIDDHSCYTICGQEKNLLKVNQIDPVHKFNFSYCIKEKNDLTLKDLIDLQTTSPSQFESFVIFNKLFYAAGVMKDTIEKYFNSERDLIDIMWDDHGFNKDPKHFEKPDRLELYFLGLEVLREFNSKATFVMNKGKMRN